MESEYSRKISDEEIAVITAAIHYYLGTEKKFRIINVERKEPSYWKIFGRIYQMEKSHYFNP